MAGVDSEPVKGCVFFSSKTRLSAISRQKSRWWSFTRAAADPASPFPPPGLLCDALKLLLLIREVKKKGC